MRQIHRRNFLKFCSLFSVSSGIISLVTKANAESNSGAAQIMRKLINLDDAAATCSKQASGFGYVDNLSSAISSKSVLRETKDGTPPEKQTCENCEFFNYEKKKPVEPTCRLMPNCMVKPKASCNVWSKRNSA